MKAGNKTYSVLSATMHRRLLQRAGSAASLRVRSRAGGTGPRPAEHLGRRVLCREEEVGLWGRAPLRARSPETRTAAAGRPAAASLFRAGSATLSGACAARPRLTRAALMPSTFRASCASATTDARGATLHGPVSPSSTATNLIHRTSQPRRRTHAAPVARLLNLLSRGMMGSNASAHPRRVRRAVRTGPPGDKPRARVGSRCAITPAADRRHADPRSSRTSSAWITYRGDRRTSSPQRARDGAKVSIADLFLAAALGNGQDRRKGRREAASCLQGRRRKMGAVLSRRTAGMGDEDEN